MPDTCGRNEQLAFISALTGGLIHEIKNPLNTMSLNLQLLAEDFQGAETPEQRRALRRISLLQSETKRLTTILDEFLNFVRGHKLSLSECDLNQVIEEVTTFILPELRSKSIELRQSLNALPRCRLDVNLIKQVLINLILNAEQAMEDGRPREIMLRSAAENGHVRVDVIDTGKGMAPEVKARIFEAFYSTRKGGTGLGLPTARRIIEEHGGQIIVHSEPGRGSCFTVTLPLKPAEPE